MDKEIIDRLVADYENGMRLFELASKYNIPSSNIISKLRTLKLFVPTSYRWSKSDTEKLKKYYPASHKDMLLVLFPGRTWVNLIDKASDLGIKRIASKSTARPAGRKYWHWQQWEIDLIRDNYEYMLLDDLCALLPDRSRSTIKTYAHNMNLVSKDWSSRTVAVGSYRNMLHFIRSNNRGWRNRSMQASNYKCIVSGKRFDAIHHLVGFNQIVEETFLEHPEIVVRDCVQDYTTEELNYILECFFVIQDRYPLGVCLTKNVHTEFHSAYGFGNNTEAQFLEFVKNYNTTNPVTITA